MPKTSPRTLCAGFIAYITKAIIKAQPCLARLSLDNSLIYYKFAFEMPLGYAFKRAQILKLSMKTSKIERVRIARLPVKRFAKDFGLKLDKLAKDFLKHHKIVTVADLLGTSVLRESDATWRALGDPRQALRKMGFTRNNREHPFLITTI